MVVSILPTASRLSRFIPITFEPAVPRASHNNLVDAAIAEGELHDLGREIHWTGHARGWRRKANVTVGTLVQKTGRINNYTSGRITAINARGGSRAGAVGDSAGENCCGRDAGPGRRYVPDRRAWFRTRAVPS